MEDKNTEHEQDVDIFDFIKNMDIWREFVHIKGSEK